MGEVNLVVYKAAIPAVTPPVYQRILPRLETLNAEFTIVEPKSLLRLRPLIRPVLTLTNRAFREIYGSLPYEEREMDDFANRFILFLNPNLCKVIFNQNKELIAYLVAMPDISEGLQKCKGHLLPTGILSVLRSGKKSNRMIMVLGAIDESYRGRGLDVMLALKLFASARKAGKTIMDSHLVLENNHAMRSEYEQIGGEVYKRYRIFAKRLDNQPI
jgi:ribosomal protein S18 acetylase RimI-like enzyme